MASGTLCWKLGLLLLFVKNIEIREIYLIGDINDSSIFDLMNVWKLSNSMIKTKKESKWKEIKEIVWEVTIQNSFRMGRKGKRMRM